MNIIKTVTTLILAGMLVSGVVMAQEKLAEKLSKSVIIMDVTIQGCAADAAILCPGLPLNSRNSLMCLSAYEANLSTSCLVGIVETALAVEQSIMALNYSIQACEADADKFCLDVPAGEGRILQCLKQNESELANQCVTALKDTGLWNIVGQ